MAKTQAVDLVIRIHWSTDEDETYRDAVLVAEELIAETRLDTMKVADAHWEPCPPD